MKKAMLFFAVILAAMGCSKEDTPTIPLMEDPNIAVETFVLPAVIDDDTLVSNLDSESASYSWTEEDVVKLCRVEDGDYTGDIFDLTWAKDTRFYITETIPDGDYVVCYTGDWDNVTLPAAGGKMTFDVGALQTRYDLKSRLGNYLFITGELSVEGNEVVEDEVRMIHRTAVMEFVANGADHIEFVMSSPKTLSYSMMTLDATSTMVRSEPTNTLSVSFVDDTATDPEAEVDSRSTVWVALNVWEISDVEVESYSVSSSILSQHKSSMSGDLTLTSGAVIPLATLYDTNDAFFASGTEFEIATAEDLWKLAKATNLGCYSGFLYYTLTQTADIDLSDYENWTPIGLDAAPFKGTYDGGHFKIKNLHIDDQTITDSTMQNSARGLFGCIVGANTNYTTHAYIKNVVLESGYVSASGRAVGGICGYSFQAQFYDCYNGATVVCTGEYDDLHTYAGGIVGLAGTNVTFIGGCMNDGEISATGTLSNAVGGIIGGTIGTGTSWNNSTMVLNCLNTAAVDANASADESYAGGIIGYLSANASSPRIYLVANLQWSTSVSGNMCGNIAGYAAKTTSTSVTEDTASTIRYCYARNASIGAIGGGDVAPTNYKTYLDQSLAQEGWGVAPLFWAVNSHFNATSAWDESYIYWDQSTYDSVTSRPRLNLEAYL